MSVGFSVEMRQLYSSRYSKGRSCWDPELWENGITEASRVQLHLTQVSWLEGLLPCLLHWFYLLGVRRTATWAANYLKCLRKRRMLKQEKGKEGRRERKA